MSRPALRRNVTTPLRAAGAGRRAFTLVELLVVIGIIALLIALLLPALRQSREQARAIACASRLRQLHLAFMGYAAEHKGNVRFSNYPARWVDAESGATGSGSSFWFGFARYPSWHFLVAEDGLLHPYINASQGGTMFDCPAIAGTDLHVDPRLRYRGTSDALAYGANILSTSMGRTHGLSSVRHASETVMLADAATREPTTGGLTRTMWIMWPRGMANLVPPADHRVVEHPLQAGMANDPYLHGRHNDRANVVWYDGHVSAEALTYAGTLSVGLEAFKSLKLGHLPRGDMASLDASYYFFFNKETRTLLP